MGSRGEGISGNTVWDQIYASGGYEEPPDTELVSLCSRLPAGRALDVGAGEGRHALWLAAHGWAVDAIDISAEGIAKLKRRAEAYGLQVNCQVGNAASHSYEHSGYELVLSTGVVLNFFQKTEAKALLQRLKTAVKPLGCLYISVSTVADPSYRQRRDQAARVEGDDFFVPQWNHWVTAFQPQELAACCDADWEILDYREREVQDTHGTPHIHRMAFLSARRKP